MLAKVKQRVADGRIIDLLEDYLKAGVMESGKGWQPTGAGTPQGAVISPLLANLYLNELDHLMAQCGMEMVRYADDFVVLCRNEAEAGAALAKIQSWVEAAGLKLHPTKTRVVNASEPGGFDFLGYHFERYQNGSGKKWPRKKSLLKLRQSIREKTGRLRSQSLETIIAEINPTLKGWYAYFKASLPTALDGVDGWVRRRLRSLVRYRRGRRGISKGRENAELTNQWFAARGLFSLAEAQRRSLQSHS
jgi:RNA-directed DNA polymerase